MVFVDETLVTLIKASPSITAFIGTNPSRIFPDTIGNAVRPALAYQRISNPREHSLRGESDLGRLRMQFTVFARNALEREQMIAALRDVLVPFNDYPTGVIDVILYDDARNTHDAATRDYLSAVDFIIWHKEP